MKNQLPFLLASETILLVVLIITPLSGRPAEAPDAAFQVLPGQRLLLGGDSIAKGFGFGNYTDQSPLRTLYGIARILMKQNLSHPPQFLYLPGIWDGLNPDGSPETVD